MTQRERINFSSKSPFEPLRGYSRAVEINGLLLISGTTALMDNGEVVGIGDPYEQTRCIISKARTVLSKAGFVLNDVVRTRLFVTNISRWDDYARAHRESFELIRPASTIVQVQKLVDPRLMVEMEFEALRGFSSAKGVSIEWNLNLE